MRSSNAWRATTSAPMTPCRSAGAGCVPTGATPTSSRDTFASKPRVPTTHRERRLENGQPRLGARRHPRGRRARFDSRSTLGVRPLRETVSGAMRASSRTDRCRAGRARGSSHRSTQTKSERDHARVRECPRLREHHCRVHRGDRERLRQHDAAEPSSRRPSSRPRTAIPTPPFRRRLQRRCRRAMRAVPRSRGNSSAWRAPCQCHHCAGCHPHGDCPANRRHGLVRALGVTASKQDQERRRPTGSSMGTPSHAVARTASTAHQPGWLEGSSASIGWVALIIGYLHRGRVSG